MESVQPMELPAQPKVMGDDEQFHATDEAVDLSGTPPEAWVALAIFWLLGVTVFYQFFTRYVLNNSASWTEEIARYLLIGTVFVGAAIGVVKNNHIQVDLLYRYLPRRRRARDGHRGGRAAHRLLRRHGGAHRADDGQAGRTTQMTIIDLPMNIVYGVCLFGFAVMTLRSIWVARAHWRRGYSVLERPGVDDGRPLTGATHAQDHLPRC